MQSQVQVFAAPDSHELLELQFKLHRSVQVYDPSLTLPSSRFNLVASASKYGLVFAGSPDKALHVFRVKDLIEGEGKKCPRRIVALPSRPVHLALNGDDEMLSVALDTNETLSVAVYDVKSFAQPNPKPNRTIQLTTAPGVQLCSLEWNPCQADSLAVCTSDGKLSIFQCKPGSIDVQSKPTNARCLSWSPKGKQIVTGNSDGTVSQYKPDLTLVKTIPPPQLYENNSSEVLAIQWISTYQFGVVYNDSSNSESSACVTILNTPKSGVPTCINYEDICYSSESFRCLQFYLTHSPQWGVIFASSSDSMEVGVLGTSDQVYWQQWIQLDEARAELPLLDNKSGNYPAGVCFDVAATIQLPWGEGTKLPHMPMIHVLSHTGLLVTFFAINVLPNAASICINPQDISIPNNLFTENVSNAQSSGLSEKSAITQHDISFVISPNTVTSTPAAPKVEQNMFASMAKNSIPPAANNKIADNNQFVNKALNFPSPNVNSASILPPPTNQPVPSNKVSNQSPQTLKSNLPNDQLKVKDNVSQIVEPSHNGKKNTVEKPGIQAVPNEIIKAMLTKEVNNFQQELFELLQKCTNIDMDIGTPDEMNKIATILSENGDPIINNATTQEIKRQVTVLKHNLISTCAFLAEAKMQPATFEMEQLSQLDPVSADKMTSIKMSTYYVESQLNQINSALDEQWEIFQEECKKKAMALRGINDSDYMKMPTLDKIYQPLLKQSDILAKQQAIVSSLEKSIAALKLPKKSNLEKQSKLDSADSLAKGMLNISLKSTLNSTVAQENLENKHDSLRKILKNHKTVTIKPIKVDAPSIIEIFKDWDLNLEKEEKTTPEKDFSSKNISAGQTYAPSEINTKAVQTSSAPLSYNPLSNLNSMLSTINDKKSDSISTVAIPNKEKEKTPQSGAPNVTVTNTGKPAVISGATKTVFNTTAVNPASISTTMAAKITSPPQVATFAPSTTSFMTNIQPSANNAKMANPVLPAFPTFSKTAEIVNKPPAANISKAPQSSENAPKPSTDPKVSFSSLTFGSTDQSQNLTTQNKNTTFDFSFKLSAAPASTSNSIFGASSTVSTSNSIFGSSSTVSTSNSIFGSSSTVPTSKSIFGAPPTSSTSINPNSASSTFNFVPNKTPTSTPIDVKNVSPATTSIFGGSITSASTTKANSENKTPIFNFSTANISGKNAVANKDAKDIVGSTPQAQATLSDATSSVATTLAPTPTKSDPIITISPVSSSLEITNQPKSEPSISIIPLPVTTPVATTVKKDESSVATVKDQSEVISSNDNKTAIADKVDQVAEKANTSTATFGFGSLSTSSSSIFGAPSQAPLAASNASTASSIFAAAAQALPPVSSQSELPKPAADVAFPASPTSSNVFGQATAPTTCASALFGAANASIDTSVISLFGNTNITTTTTASSIFKSPTASTGSLFGGFGGQATFGTQPAGGSIFGGGGASGAFGQPQSPQNNSVFGGTATFGALGSNTQSPNIFGQTTQSSSIFGAATSPAQNVFGGSPLTKSTFGTPVSPATPQQSSIFGTPPATAAGAVFGGSPTFGSKAVFGQPASFGSPSGSFGMFSGGEQPSVAQSGFGSPSSFGKPADVFGRSPEFGTANAFGAAPAFGSSPIFNSGAAAFSSPMGGFGGGTQQSSTFESLATQSSLSFGNLAQQSQQPSPSQPVFQGSPSFSTWR